MKLDGEHYFFFLVGDNENKFNDAIDITGEFDEFDELAEVDKALEDFIQNQVEGLETDVEEEEHTFTNKELEEALKKSKIIGDIGEALVKQYLEQCQGQRLIHKFIWQSQINAVSPYDFRVQNMDGTWSCLDVKTTMGEFDSILHITYSELCKMCERERYYIFRVYKLADNKACLRKSERVNEFAREIMRSLRTLPDRIRVDGISLHPNSSLRFDDGFPLG